MLKIASLEYIPIQINHNFNAMSNIYNMRVYNTYPVITYNHKLLRTVYFKQSLNLLIKSYHTATNKIIHHTSFSSVGHSHSGKLDHL
jgi:hypothetical protein